MNDFLISSSSKSIKQKRLIRTHLHNKEKIDFHFNEGEAKEEKDLINFLSCQFFPLSRMINSFLININDGCEKCSIYQPKKLKMFDRFCRWKTNSKHEPPAEESSSNLPPFFLRISMQIDVIKFQCFLGYHDVICS